MEFRVNHLLICTAKFAIMIWMAKSRKKTAKSQSQTRHGLKRGASGLWRFADPKSVFFLILLFAGIVITVMASLQSTRPFNYAACNDRGCVPFTEGGYSTIINCADTNDANGDWQQCSYGGRMGMCGGQQYCCPATGGTWTTNLAACPQCAITAASNFVVQNITGTSAMLTWTPGTGGNYVKLWVSKSSSPVTDCGRLPSKTTDASCVANENTDYALTAVPSSYQLNNLTPNTNYYYTVMMWKLSGCDAGGGVLSFKTAGSPTNTPKPTATTAPTSTAAPTHTSRPTSTPMNTTRPTSTPRPTSTGRPTLTPRATSTLRPTITPTPTKTPALTDVCGKSCVTDTDCQLGLTCTTVFVTLRACRNRLCTDKPGCLCDDSSGSFFFATPTPGPGGLAMRSLPLTVGGFSDKKGQTGENPTISGLSEPEAKITVTVYPDGVGGEVYADKTGKWTYKFTKKLTPGAKSVLVVATKPDGQAQVNKTFTVVGGGGPNVFGIILTIMILVAVGFGVYVYVKSNQ